MSKSRKPDTASCDDDVAGLFKRLGADGDAGYRDFGNQRLRPPPPPAPAPLAPARSDTAARPAPVAAPAPAPVVTEAPAAPAQTPAAAPRAMRVLRNPPAPARTPLQQLFDRLAGEGGTPGTESPLRRLRGS